MQNVEFVADTLVNHADVACVTIQGNGRIIVEKLDGTVFMVKVEIH